MTALQKVALGTAPDGKDGDPTRTGFDKANENVDVLSTQLPLQSAPLVTEPLVLGAAHIGKRVMINLAQDGAVSPPDASSCTADSVLLLVNVGSTVVSVPPATGSGNSVGISKLHPGEGVLLHTDGVENWTVLLRGRTAGEDEAIAGTLTVSGNIVVDGAAGTNRQLFVQSAGEPRWALLATSAAEAGQNAGSDLGISRFDDSGVFVDSPILISRATGAAAMKVRPTFAGNTPWDSGNLAAPMRNAPQTFNVTPPNAVVGAPATNYQYAFSFTAPAAGAAQCAIFCANATIAPTAVATSASNWYMQIRLQKKSDGSLVAQSPICSLTTWQAGSGAAFALSASLAVAGLIAGTVYDLYLVITAGTNPGVGTQAQYMSAQGLIF